MEETTRSGATEYFTADGRKISEEECRRIAGTPPAPDGDATEDEPPAEPAGKKRR